MAVLQKRAAALFGVAKAIMDEAARIRGPGPDADRVNGRMLALSRHVIPMLFHPGDRFDFSPGACPCPVPGLYDGERMLQAAEGSDGYYRLMTQFVRGVNRLSAACAAAIDDCAPADGRKMH
jgi:hypothetical protein